MNFQKNSEINCLKTNCFQKDMDRCINILDDHIIDKNIGLSYTFNKRYLLDLEQKNESSIQLDIKSPYDPGKTQLSKYM